jgi:aryl-alcohol dehydrogenase-like predicted oxidoreductase
MERRQFGKTDMKTSVLGFGGAEIGFQKASLTDVDRLLGQALDAGLNVIDTAECYADSEELIGKAVSHRRQDYYLFTKCGHAAGFDLPDWSPELLEKSIDRSLKRLRTDYVDVIHLHSCSADVLRQGTVIEVLQKAKQAGKTRYIGYSGDSSDALFAVELGVFDSFETSVSIADQEAIDLTIPKAMERGMGIITKRPIANAAWLHMEKPSDTYIQPYWERLQKLNYEFTHASIKESVATALRFTFSVPGVHTAIVGTAKPERYVENANIVAEGPLSQDEFQAIRNRWREVADADWVGKV